MDHINWQAAKGRYALMVVFGLPTLPEGLVGPRGETVHLWVEHSSIPGPLLVTFDATVIP